MDGLKISNGPMIRGEFGVGGVGSSQVQGTRQENSATSVSGGGSNFVQTLKDAIASVDQLQKDSDIKMQQLATGQNNNIHETMIAAEKADIALRLMVQVRNKIIEAYQEVMRMQV